MPPIASLLETARKKLVETGTRNRLIHVNRSAKRGNFLNIVNERTEDIFQLLRGKGKKMRFAGTGQEQGDDLDNGVILEDVKNDKNDESRYTDSILDTPLTPDALQKRLLKLFKDAKISEEEQGINILFLAMGFIRWYEDPKSNILRESPLILLPVELVRNKRSTYSITCREDDITTNLPLQERLKNDFDIDLPDIDDANEWTPSEYFDQVLEQASGQERIEIDRDGMQLGFFSFAKLLMLRDLDPENWDEKSLLANELVGGLLANGFENEPSLFKEDVNLDEVLSPDKVFHVVDADSSQTKVIEEVRSGRNLVVQGPPGTGKSQTITNILAGAAHDGKKVIFVAEKMVALEVVYKRMCKVGLKDLCLELHSRQANKKKLLQELAETIRNGRGVQPSEFNVDKLIEVRDKLNVLTKALHTEVPDRDYKPYRVLSILVKLAGDEVPVPIFDASALEPLSSTKISELFKRLHDYVDFVREHGHEKQNPFYGSSKLDLQPTDIKRLKGNLSETLENLDWWINFQRELKKHLIFIDVVQNNLGRTQFSKALEIGCDWEQHKESLSKTVIESVWNQKLDHLRPALVKGMFSWFSRLFGKYRPASNELASYLRIELPKNPKERVNLLDMIIGGRAKRDALDDKAEFLKSEFGEAWEGYRTSFSQIVLVTTWVKGTTKDVLKFSSEKIKSLIVDEEAALFDSAIFDKKRESLGNNLKNIIDKLGLSDLSGKAIDSLSLTDLRGRISSMLEGLEKYPILVKHHHYRKQLLEYPVEPLLDLMEQRTLILDAVEKELRYALNESRWEYIRNVVAPLRDLVEVDRHDLVERFKDYEKTQISNVKRLIKETHLSQIPRGSAGEMGLIRGEIGKKTKHIAIRKLMTRASGMIQKIKPIFLMSPISVAQFLPPGKVEFDLLVIDEASQVRPEDALGSVARAKQVVVVGDQEQLPPTNFFSRLTDNSNDLANEEEEGSLIVGATEMESILSLCEARGLNERMLEWHYRSRHPSLITVSNSEFYRNKLILPPCPTQEDDTLGMKLVTVPGAYSSASQGEGRPRTNKIEAEHIVKRVQELAASSSDLSVGIATFSKSQADMVTEILELKRREDPALDKFLREDKNENVFVKNIENVQGDERDIILISVCYGPYEPNGKLRSMRFGPINNEGGKRRLNVLFSRSRIACEVFTSFNPSDIDTQRTENEGLIVLKKFLEYAKTGVIIENYTSQGDADSLFEEDVAQAVIKLGYDVEHQVGTAGFKIDLGVKDPENTSQYILAIECDGATYHSSIWARERDRLRQEILESFGWRFHRIWSTDWFRNRKAEIERFASTLKKAQATDLTSSFKGANNPSNIVEHEIDTDQAVEPIVLEEEENNTPKYRKANIKIDAKYEPHERPLPQVCDLLIRIVNIEGPIHTDEIIKRYANGHGKSRIGDRIKEKVALGLSTAKKEKTLVKKGYFWGTNEQFQNPPIRDRSRESSPTTNVENISPDEIVACAVLAEEECGSIEQAGLIREIARKMGFKRAGPDFQTAVKKALRKNCRRQT